MSEEKSKGKTHPFAGHLRPAEEVLWLSSPAQPGAWNQLLILGGIIAVVAVSVGIGVMTDNDLNTDDRVKIVAVLGGGSLALAVLYLLIRGVIKLFTRNRPPERAYAITNERLLYRNKKDVSSIPLEKLPSISLFLGDGTKGTFSFGALFPMWPDVEDAIHIKHLIDDAQKKRINHRDEATLVR